MNFEHGKRMTPTGRARLIADEGLRLKVYDDKTGEPIDGLPSGGVPTIGIGRNLAGRGLTEAEAYQLFDNDLASMNADILRMMPWVRTLADARSDVVEMVEFNTGNVFGFRKMLTALCSADWEGAAAQLLDSEAARAAPARYERMAAAVRSGTWD